MSPIYRSSCGRAGWQTGQSNSAARSTCQVVSVGDSEISSVRAESLRVPDLLAWSARATFVLFVLLYWTTTGKAQVLDASWRSPANGVWTDASNWSSDPRFPNFEDGDESVIATIDVAGSPYTVSFAAEHDIVGISELRLNSPDVTLEIGEGNFKVVERLTIQEGRLRYGSGELRIPGVLESYGRVEVDSTSLDQQLPFHVSRFNNYGTMDVRGDVRLDGNLVDLASTGQVHLNDGSRLEINAAVEAGSLRNFTGQISPGAVQLNRDYLNDTRVSDPNDWPVYEGRLFGSGGAVRGGTLRSDTHFALGTYNNVILDEVTIDGHLRVDSYPVEVVGSLTLESAQVTINDSMKSSSGRFDPSVPITGQGTIRVHATESAASVFGPYLVDSGIAVSLSSENEATAILGVEANDGTIVCQGVGSRCRLSFERNRGSIEVREGELALETTANFAQSTGPIVVDQGGVLRLNDSYSYQFFENIDLRSGHIVHNGSFLLQLNTLQLNSSQSVIGRIEHGDVVIPRGETVVMGGVVPDIAVAGRMEVEGLANEVAVEGVVTLDNGVVSIAAREFVVDSIEGTGTIEFRPGGRLNVASGLLNLSSGLKLRTVDTLHSRIIVDQTVNQGRFEHAGDLAFHGRVTNESELILTEGAVLNASTLESMSGALIEVRPGAELWTSELVLGQENRLRVQFATDQLAKVNSNWLTPDGTLEVQFAKGYYPEPNSRLSVISSGDREEGEFDEFLLPATADGFEWNTELLAERGDLQLIDTATQRIAGTEFLEPELEERTYSNPDGTELGFTTVSSTNDGARPFTGVANGDSGGRQFLHRSVDATTIFESVDLAAFGLVELELDWDVSPIAQFEQDDRISISVTDGNQAIQLVDIERLSTLRNNTGVFPIPDSWNTATVIFSSTTDSSSGAEWFALERLAFRGKPLEFIVPGDFNGNGMLDLGDLKQLDQAIATGTVDMAYDRNMDGRISVDDRAAWVHGDLGTYFGDANLDGLFDSTDLIQVFQAGKYEDEVFGNSNWTSGDWNGDGDFDTSDIVLAFRNGAYVQSEATAAVVPEPRALLIPSLALVILLHLQRMR